MLQNSILFSQATQLNLKKEFPVLQAGSDLWIGTPGGLYQYKSADDSYKLYSIPGKEGMAIRYLYYDSEWLWCILDTGTGRSSNPFEPMDGIRYPVGPSFRQNQCDRL